MDGNWTNNEVNKDRAGPLDATSLSALVVVTTVVVVVVVVVVVTVVVVVVVIEINITCGLSILKIV